MLHYYGTIHFQVDLHVYVILLLCYNKFNHSCVVYGAMLVVNVICRGYSAMYAYNLAMERCTYLCTMQHYYVTANITPSYWSDRITYTNTGSSLIYIVINVYTFLQACYDATPFLVTYSYVVYRHPKLKPKRHSSNLTRRGWRLLRKARGTLLFVCV